MKKVAETSPETRSAFDALARVLGTRGASVGAMFGMESLKGGGKAFAGLFGDAIVFKLQGDAHANAIALAGAELFDPSGMGRAMKEWVVVPKKHAKRWGAIAEQAFEYATGAGGAKVAPKAKAKAKAKTTIAKKKTTSRAR